MRFVSAEQSWSSLFVPGKKKRSGWLILTRLNVRSFLVEMDRIGPMTS